jgi:hypothetical protein
MGSEDLIEITRIYIDAKGAGRLYIPKEVALQLGCHNKEKMLLNLEGGVLAVTVAEKNGGNIK